MEFQNWPGKVMENDKHTSGLENVEEIWSEAFLFIFYLKRFFVVVFLHRFKCFMSHLAAGRPS